MPPRLNGVFTALVTPFKGATQKFAVDYEAFRLLCKRQIDSGIQGLVHVEQLAKHPPLPTRSGVLLSRLPLKNQVEMYL